MMRLRFTLLIAAGALALAGCPKKPMTLPPPAEPAATQEPAATGAAGEGRVGEARELPGAGGTGSATTGPAGAALVIYFEYDSSDIRADFAGAISAHARHLATMGATRVRLEGHTDERGTREYNIALGERRAQAVRRALLLQGAADAQVTTVSYGEERPAVDGSDDSAWTRNRRVEIVYGR
ncbi:MAG: peptidoglycan-associated lipoprotein Pal [Gammaproteobacteria bacterium]|nr:MAG: peptidoglycan-associated lipoprotein Pal [Gammaproteobacteria bacterium]